MISRVLFLAVLMAFAAQILADAPSETGACAAFTSDDSVIRMAVDLLKTGNFAVAETVLSTNSPSSDPAANQARADLLDVIARTRREYSLTPADLLAQIRQRLPDATELDVLRWTEAGALRPRTIDDKTLYFRRDVSNLFLFSPDARNRLPKQDAPNPAWKLSDHLSQIVREAESTGKDEVVPCQHRVEYTLTVPPSSLKAGALVRIWLPYPQEYHWQKDVKLISASLPNPQIAPPAIEGNPVQHAQRTVYFEQRVKDPTKPITAKITFEYTAYAYYPNLDESKVQPLPADWNGAYLGERLPHVKFTPAMVDQVKQIVGNETNPLIKAKKIFRWVSANIPWNAEVEYCIVPSLSEYGFTRHRGDCGVQNTVFTTLCRIAGIPARWQSGWETKPSDWTMHDWSEIYVAPWGWIPTDASYGVQKSDDPKIADFYCGHIDSHRMIVNLDYGRQLDPPKESIRSEPADFQRGEVEMDGKNLYFDQWDYDIRVWCDGKEI
jgi:transglutaminase-like putative cysteine protease